jgi:hypothetical protein
VMVLPKPPMTSPLNAVLSMLRRQTPEVGGDIGGI